MFGINRMSSSSKKMFSSSRICVVPSFLYSKHGDMLPKSFIVPLNTTFKCFDFATSQGGHFTSQGDIDSCDF